MKNKIIAMAFLMLISFQSFASPILSLATYGIEEDQKMYNKLPDNTEVTVFDDKGKIIGNSIVKLVDQDPTWIWYVIAIGMCCIHAQTGSEGWSVEFDCCAMLTNLNENNEITASSYFQDREGKKMRTKYTPLEVQKTFNKLFGIEDLNKVGSVYFGTKNK